MKLIWVRPKGESTDLPSGDHRGGFAHRHCGHHVDRLLIQTDLLQRGDGYLDDIRISGGQVPSVY